MGGWGESGSGWVPGRWLIGVVFCLLWVACARLFDAIKLLMCKEIKSLDSCCFLCELCAQNKEFS